MRPMVVAVKAVSHRERKSITPIDDGRSIDRKNPATSGWTTVPLTGIGIDSTRNEIYERLQINRKLRLFATRHTTKQR